MSSQNTLFPLDSFYISWFVINFKMVFGLYDKEGILRYINSDRDACIAYAELFDLNSANYSLMSLNENDYKLIDINLDQNQEENNS